MPIGLDNKAEVQKYFWFTSVEQGAMASCSLLDATTLTIRQPGCEYAELWNENQLCRRVFTGNP